MKKYTKVKTNLILYRFLPLFLFRKGIFCGFLLSFLLAGTESCPDMVCSDVGTDRIGFAVIRTGFSEYFVGRGRIVLCLGYLLEIGFRVDIELFFEYLFKRGVYVLLHKLLGLAVSEVEIEGSEECFECIRDYVRIGIPSGKQFTLGYEDIVLEMESETYGCEVFTTNEGTAYIGQFSLWFLRIGVEEEFCGYELEHSISEELQAFIALRNMDDILVQDRTMNEGEAVIGDIFEWNLKRRYE